MRNNLRTYANKPISTKPASVDDHQRNRCAWRLHNERCRYVGSWSDDTRGGGPLYCREHSAHGSMEDGSAILDRSMAQVPHNVDYSTEALVHGTRRLFRNSEIIITVMNESSKAGG